MRIIFLNSWYGKAGKKYYDFISKNSSAIDIFCLSEINPELFSKLEEILPAYKGFYERSLYDRNMGYVYGQASFFKKGVIAKSLRKIDIFRNVWNDFGFASPFELSTSGKLFYLLNIHGKARPGTKLDTPARIHQSQKIIEFLKDKKGPKIVGGDFNLMPFTKSVAVFEEAGFRNLIKDFDIKETRNRLSWEQFPNEEKQHFADFCFISPDIKVKKFEVPNVEISDHLPLILDFEL